MIETMRSPVAKRFVSNLFLDIDSGRSDCSIWVDFGFNNASDPRRLYAAYQRALKTDKASPDDFDKAVGEGEALTAIVQMVDPELSVETDYDMFFQMVDPELSVETDYDMF